MGDEIKDEVKSENTSIEGGEENAVPSSEGAADNSGRDDAAWEKVSEYLESGEVIHVKIGGITNKGVIAHVEGIRGFIPASKLDTGFVENLEDYLLKEVDVKVITVDRAKNRLVLSAREVLREKEKEERLKKIDNLKIGTVCEGRVDGIKPYGAFVDIGDDITGLLHISQISHKRIESCEEVIHNGDTVKVKITAIKDGKVSLSMKALEEPAAKDSYQKRDRDRDEEVFKLPKAEDATTSLGGLLKNIKL